ACGAIDGTNAGTSVVTDGGGGGTGDRRAVATKPTDGAPGICCTPSTGGCAAMGGYHADGHCPEHDEICDNMCEQRIVPDEHGCFKLTYKSPPVTTTYAGTESCSA